LSQDLHAIAKKAYLQLGVSVLAFVVFCVWELAEVFLFPDQRNLWSIVPMAAAFLLLPRRIPIGDIGEAPGEDGDLAARLASLRDYCTYLRGIYLVTAIVLVFVLPRILPAAG
jgi:hypothetical protein